MASAGILSAYLKSAAIYVRNFIFVGQQYNSYQLWYLLSAIYGILFLTLLKKLKSPCKSILVVLLIVVISLGCTALANYTDEIGSSLALVRSVIKMTIINGRIFQGMYFIPIGYALPKQRINISLGITVFVLTLIMRCFFINDSVVSGILLILSSIGLFEIVTSINLKNSDVYIELREMSITIYLIHMYVWTAFYMVVFGQKTYGVIPFVGTTIISTVISFTWLCVKRNDVNNIVKSNSMIDLEK